MKTSVSPALCLCGCPSQRCSTAPSKDARQPQRRKTKNFTAYQTLHNLIRPQSMNSTASINEQYRPTTLGHGAFQGLISVNTEHRVYKPYNSRHKTHTCIRNTWWIYTCKYICTNCPLVKLTHSMETNFSFKLAD